MKVKESRIMIIIVLLITLILVILYNVISLENKNHKNSEEEEKIPLPNCLSKDSVCSKEEIKKGIRVRVNVSSKTSYVFYVISNDEENVTLLLNKDIVDSKWSTESNVYGPDLALKSLGTKTKDWTNIQKLSNYDYSDYGFIRLLRESKTFDGGYFLLNVTDGVMELQVNSLAINQDQKITEDYELKARLITYEEVKELESNGKLPDWLIKNLEEGKGYWTQSSSTENEKEKNNSAFVLMNQEKAKLKSKIVSSNFGIRPVITISKEQLKEQ